MQLLSKSVVIFQPTSWLTKSQINSAYALVLKVQCDIQQMKLVLKDGLHPPFQGKNIHFIHILGILSMIMKNIEMNYILFSSFSTAAVSTFLAKPRISAVPEIKIFAIANILNSIYLHYYTLYLLLYHLFLVLVIS